MTRFFTSVFSAIAICAFHASAMAGGFGGYWILEPPSDKNLKPYDKNIAPHGDCDEPAAVSSLQSLMQAAALVRSQSRTPISLGEAAAKLRVLPAETSVATYMQTFDITSATGYEVAQLNQDPRMAESALVQKAGDRPKVDPCFEIHFRRLPDLKQFHMMKKNLDRNELLKEYKNNPYLEKLLNDPKVREALEDLRTRGK